MLLATSAFSMDLRPTVGISGNIGVYAATGIENNFNDAGSAIDETTKEHGAFAAEFGSVFVEMGLNDVVSIGLDYVPQALETPRNTSNDGGVNTNTVEAHFEDLTTLYAKINLPLGGAYLKAGFSQVDVIINENMESGNTYKDVDTEGMVAGIGYGHDLANGISIRAEVTASNFDDVQSNNGVASGGNMNQVFVESMWGARGTVSLVKSF